VSYPGHPKPIIPPKPHKKQRESADQRAFVKALNLMRLGFFYRVKNMGTFDAARGFYRKHSDTVAIPDICGYTKAGTGVFIECKYVAKVEQKKELLFKAKISQEQKDFLLGAHRAGCRSGIAFTLDDAIAIAACDPMRYPRHPRTYLFLPEAEQEAHAAKYIEERRALALKNKDPLARDIHLAIPREEDWEKL
jgi:hypothetical protein